jgi:hypothetical protein
MGTNYLDLILKSIIAFPFGMGFILLMSDSFKRFERFNIMGNQGHSLQRFKENLFANLYTFGAAGCLVVIIFIFLDIQSLVFLPFLLCVFIPLLPFTVFMTYWKSYQSNELLGGFLPMASVTHGNVQFQAATQAKVEQSKVKLPRRIKITAVLVALLLVLSTFYELNSIPLKMSPIWSLLIKTGVSGLVGLGACWEIVIVATSHRIQQIRDGEIPGE